MATERRKHRRYGTDSKSLKAIVAGKNRIAVKDISTGGLMIEYSPVDNKPLETDVIDVMAMDHDHIFMPRINCQTVYDILMLAEDKAFTGEVIRRRGLKFVGLSKRHADFLGIVVDRIRNLPPDC